MRTISISSRRLDWVSRNGLWKALFSGFCDHLSRSIIHYRSTPPLLIVLMLVSWPVSSLPVADLYVAEVLVPDESRTQLLRGARAGLRQVLIRVSGNPDVESSSLVTRSLRDPGAYFAEFSYESSDRTLLIDGQTRSARLLRINFDPSAVSTLLRSAGFPVWGSNRPGMLVWVAISDTEGRRIAGESDPSELIELLKDRAGLRGVPLLFPLLDLEDTVALSTAEVWGSFLGRISDASDRYSPDGILSGRIVADQLDSATRWSADWRFRIGDDWQVLQSVSLNSSEVVDAVIDQLANQLASRFALDSSTGLITLHVESVHDLQDYAAVGAYLASLAPVLDTTVVRVQADEVQYQLSIEGQPEQLIGIIELDSRLALRGNNDNTLRYQWLE